MRVAVLGTGIMGAPMARNLAEAGHDVCAWNRTAAKAEGIEGVTACAEPAEAADGADALVTMLLDADAVLASAQPALGALASGAVWAQMSTVGLEGTERCAELADQEDVTLFDAPVLGTKAPAEQGALVVLAAGPQDRRDAVEPLFDAVGARTMWLGAAGEGSRLKLVCNTWVLSVVEGVAETVALAEGLDLDAKLFLEAIEGGALDIPYAHRKGEAMMQRSFEPSFPLAGARKDAELISVAAERHGLDLPLTRLLAQRFAQGVDAGHGDEDMAATFRLSAGPGG